MRKRRFFATCGEKRKFFNNMRHFGHTRDIGLAGMALLPALLPAALIAMVLFAVAVFFIGTHETHNFASAALSPKHNLTPFAGMAVFATAREMREERGRLAKAMHDMIDKRASWTTEDKTKFDKMDADQEALRVQIVDIEKAEALNTELRTAPPAPNPNLEQGDVEQRKKAEKIALRRYLLGGEMALRPEDRAVMRMDASAALHPELRDMGTGGGNALQGVGGGYFVEIGMANDVESAMKFYGGMLDATDVFDTATGGPLPYPTDNDTSNTGERIGENQQVSTQDVSIGNLIFNAWQYSTKMIKVSTALIQDSAFDIQSYLTEKMGTRLGRIVNTETTLGTGSGASMPFGIVPAATLGATATGSAANDGSAATGANSIGTDDMIELEHSVDRAYRLQKGAGWMMSDPVLKSIKKLKDKFGRPIWLPGLTANAPDTILNYGFTVNNDMASLTTGQKTLLFGLLKKYKIRRVKGLSVMRLNERFADFGQVAFIGFARYDGNLLDAGTHPVKYLQQA
jgi:HK97 family phage major capsid protein